jgi:hypothetical protein
MKKVLLQKDEIYSEDIFQILIDYEIIRSIRYPNPISLICLESTPQPSDMKTNRSAFSVFETALNSSLRSVDIPTRLGTVYLILLPMTNEAGARVVCERLLSIFENEFETKEGKFVKFSLQIGFASHGGGPTFAWEILLQTAEAGLQQSHMKGANTSVTISNR